MGENVSLIDGHIDNEIKQTNYDRLQAQNKDLAETIHNLTIEKDALFDKAEELKAEVERLKKEVSVTRDAYISIQDRYEEAQSEIERLKEFIVETRRCDKEIKSEAYKEFAERLKDMSEHFWEEKENFVSEEQIDNLLKEMVGEDE